MDKPIIKRYFSEDILESVKKDFKFLFDKIIKSGFEYDLQIRDNYFNLYYKGNSLAKVMCKDIPKYKVHINTIFFEHKDNHVRNDPRFEGKITTVGDYVCLTITYELLHPLFQGKYLKYFSSKIKERQFQEEIAFEQMLITDNMDNQNNRDLIIVDRQVMDRASATKMDLLALRHKIGNDYQFCVIEVKLGNNPELRGDVIDQLKGYIDRISDNFDDYKECYKKNIEQKQDLTGHDADGKAKSLLEKSMEINIVPDVSGIVIVGGYSGIAKKHFEKLKEKAPNNIKILHLKNEIDFSKAIN